MYDIPFFFSISPPVAWQDDDDIIDDDDTYAPEWLNPPPSVSTTPFPTTRDVPIPKLSRRVTCQASLVPTTKPTASPSLTAFPTSDKVQPVSFKVKKHVSLRRWVRFTFLAVSHVFFLF